MRRLLSVLTAIALAMLPLAGMPSAAGAAGATPCHSKPEAVALGATGDATHADHGHGVHEHGHQAHAMTVEHHAAASDAVVTHASASKPEKKAPRHCSHCGPGCICAGVCAALTGGLVPGGAARSALLDIAAYKLAPAIVAVPPSWASKPRPPPPRA